MKLNDEQQMLQDSVARLMADKGPVSHLRELRDRNDEKGYDEPLWHAMVESGLTGILVPEEHGGIGFGLRLHRGGNLCLAKMLTGGQHILAHVLGHIDDHSAPDQGRHGMRPQFGQAADRRDFLFV